MCPSPPPAAPRRRLLAHLWRYDSALAGAGAGDSPAVECAARAAAAKVSRALARLYATAHALAAAVGAVGERTPPAGTLCGAPVRVWLQRPNGPRTHVGLLRVADRKSVV